MDVTGVNSPNVTITEATDKQLIGAQVVTKTLDYMNSNQNNSSTNSDYDFQKSVLSAAFTGVGSIANVKT